MKASIDYRAYEPPFDIVFASRPSSSRSYNYYNYSAPPLVGGYGYGGFGGGGINVFPSFGVPILGLGGGFFNIIIIGVSCTCYCSVRC